MAQAKVKERVKTTVKSNVAPDVLQAQLDGTAKPPVGTSDNPSDKVLTFANFITLCRLALTIAFLVLFVNGTNRSLALVCYTTAAVTDFLDGWVARATQTVSWFGKVSDPVMDRVLLFTGVIGLVLTGELPLWVATFVIGRDVVLLCGSLYLHRFWKRPVDVVYIGKVATAFFMTGFCLLLLNAINVTGPVLTDASWLPGFNGQLTSVGIYFVYVAVVLSAITAIVYIRQGLAIRGEAIASREER